MTREFILLALKAKTSPDFDINRLVEEGRLDLVCRCVSNALYVSMKLRKDTNIHICLNGAPSEQSPKIISFIGSELAGLEPSEKDIALAIKEALKQGLNLELGEEKNVESSIRGIKVSKKAFETLVKEKSETSMLFYLDEKGKDIRDIDFNIKTDPNKNYSFILGDFIGIPKNTEKLLKRLGAEKINLGPVMLFASHCIILVNNELDRQEFY